MNLVEQVVAVVLVIFILLSIHSKLNHIYWLLKKVHLKPGEKAP